MRIRLPATAAVVQEEEQEKEEARGGVPLDSLRSFLDGSATARAV